jgi:glycosyltransferase involved in cell wall biosynthesis
MKIIQLNTHDVLGGAARAAYRLHKGLTFLDYDSSMLVRHRTSDDAKVTAYKPQMSFYARLRRLARRKIISRSFDPYMLSRPSGLDLFSDIRTQYGRHVLKQIPSCDIINLHWISGFIDYNSFFRQFSNRIPIVWTLHDMNPFTGGCHYDNGCQKFMSQCHSCPQLGSNNKTDLSSKIWNRKNALFRSVNSRMLYFIAPSKWLAETAQKSPLLSRFTISIIPNSIETDIFSPRDQKVSRQTFQIPQQAKVILFISEDITNHRKGFTALAQSLKGMANIDDLFLLSIGSGKPKFDFGLPHIHLGNINNDYLLSLAYSAADIFAIPSLQDNLPNTVLESIACGTPVVGFATGGIPDMIRDGISGILVPPQDIAALSSAIIRFIQDPIMLKEYKTNCRRISIEDYSLEVQARRYIEVYNNLMNSPGG